MRPAPAAAALLAGQTLRGCRGALQCGIERRGARIIDLSMELACFRPVDTGLGERGLMRASHGSLQSALQRAAPRESSVINESVGTYRRTSPRT